MVMLDIPPADVFGELQSGADHRDAIGAMLSVGADQLGSKNGSAARF